MGDSTLQPLEFKEFVRLHQKSLTKAAWLLTSDWQEAENLLQATFLKVWPHWGRLVKKGDPGPYVNKVMLRTYLSWRRRMWIREDSQASISEEWESVDRGVDAHMASIDLRAEIVNILAALPARQRAVLIVRFYFDMSVAESAKMLHCSEGTVKSQTAKAMANLAKAKTKENSIEQRF